jgi:hypothetical protein
VEVEGVEASGAPKGVVKYLGAEVEEDVNGEIRDTILGAYCFALWNNSSISKRG